MRSLTHLPKLVCLIVLLGAAALLGQGGWIYAKAFLAQTLIEQAWDSSATQERRPWPWADTWPVARLQVPELGVDQIALQGLEGNALAFGPGMLAMSLDGQVEPLVLLAGHRDTHFQFLQHLARGDVIRLQMQDRRWHSYSITETAVLDSDQQSLPLDNQRPGLMLITCYPFEGIGAGGSLRFVVWAEPLQARRVI